MLKKRIPISVGCIALVLVLILFILYSLPTTLLEGIEPADIQYIRVTDGSDGTVFLVDERQDVEGIVTRVQGVKMKRAGLSANYDGYRFSMTLVDKRGKTAETLILNSADTARRDPFFYEVRAVRQGVDTDEEKLPFSYLEEMKRKYAPQV